MRTVHFGRFLLLGVITAGALIACGPKIDGDTKNGGTKDSTEMFLDQTDPARVRLSMITRETAPLTVDWSFQYRKQLEARLKRGTVLVRFTNERLEFLPECKAPGRYEYVGVTPGREFVHAYSNAELQANFPFSAVSLGGRLKKDKHLTADLRVVGLASLDKPLIKRAELEGEPCRDATHYVVEVMHGGFAFGAANALAAAAKAGILGVGASGATENADDALSQDGVLGECDQASANATSPPGRCAGIVRIRIVPLEKPAGGQPACGDGTLWNGSACVSEARLGVTPASAKGKTEPPPMVKVEPNEAPVPAAPPPPSAPPETGAGVKGFACDPQKGAAECWKQCKGGNADSCAWTGKFFELGRDVPKKDIALAEKLFMVSCNARSNMGCGWLSELMVAQNRFKEAAAIATKGCDAGDAGGCMHLGYLLYRGQGVPQDRKKAYELNLRACKLREWQACNNGGVQLFFQTGGVPAEPVRACEMFKQACDATQEAGCVNLAMCTENGVGQPADLKKAVELYATQCADKASAIACIWAGLLIEKNKPELALKLYQNACDNTASVGTCVSTSELMSALPGKYDLDGIDRRSCEGGEQKALGCYNAALMYERGIGGTPRQLPRATMLLERACKGGLKKACRPAGFLPP
ncbi:MAG: sel1 repeat family protein [Deltaproteobacteria bacterium]|nr:sel1 repeat family protein [Deltaproteobacteria bacterium]